MIDTIRRSRDYHLYSDAGQRFLDMHMDSGGAFCGHRPHGLTAALKRVLSRGGLAAVPSRECVRAEKAMKALPGKLLLNLPEAEYRVCYLPPGLPLSALPVVLAERSLYLYDCWSMAEPRVSDSHSIVLLRPGYSVDQLQQRLLGQIAGSSRETIPAALVPVLPMPRGITPQPILLRRDISQPAIGLEHPAEIGAKAVVSGINLLLEPRFPSWSTKRSDIIWSPRSLEQRGWQNWASSGPYQYFSGNENEYHTWYVAALKMGVLLPPDRSEPAILPSVISAHEDNLLDRLQTTGKNANTVSI